MGPRPGARLRRMELTPAPTLTRSHALEGPAARSMDAGGGAGVNEPASRPWTAEPREGQRLLAESGEGEGRKTHARRAAERKMRLAHGLTRASSIGLASLAGVKVKVSAAKLGSAFQVSRAS